MEKWWLEIFIKIFERMKQTKAYFTEKFTKEMEDYAKEKLTNNEYKIFLLMGRYDKIHCVKCAMEVEKNIDKFKKSRWITAALLHDCGKPKNKGYISRSVNAIFHNIKGLYNHAETGYIILKDINIDAAEIIKRHHDENLEGLYKLFQEIDNKS